MIALRIDDMTCGHCAAAIHRALKTADPEAHVEIDVARHRVVVEPVAAQADELAEAIREAGYTPVVEDRQADDRKGPAAGRSCCGTCH